MAMEKRHVWAVLLVTCIVSLLASGCADKNSPRGTVMLFLGAVKAANRVELDNILSFDRLIIEEDGEKYASLPPQEQAPYLANFKENMLTSLTKGKLRFFGQIDAQVRDERVSGDKAEVVIYEKENKSKAYAFTLAREGGKWKIYRIVTI